MGFKKQFNNYYWLTPPADFVRNHFPQDPKWTLIKNYTKNTFSLNPYYDVGSINHIKLIEPSSGVIHIKKGDTLRFKIAYTEQLNYLQINTNNFHSPDIWTEKYVNKHKTIKMLDTLAIKKQQYIPYKQNGDIYEFAYTVKDNTLDYLDILFDWQRTIRFKLTYR